MIVTTIARTIRYSPTGNERRTSTIHATRNDRPTNTSTPPTIIRGMNPTTAAPKTTAASGTSAATSPAPRPSTSICCASAVRLSAWYPGIPPKRPVTTFTNPASRSASFVSRSVWSRSSTPPTLNRHAITATNTAVAIPADWSSTADQSAPPSARRVQSCQSRVEVNGPSSHSPSARPGSTTP